jgi:hypothetical protein
MPHKAVYLLMIKRVMNFHGFSKTLEQCVIAKALQCRPA